MYSRCQKMYLISFVVVQTVIWTQTEPTSHPFLIILTCMPALAPQVTWIQRRARCFCCLRWQQSNCASNLLSLEMLLKWIRHTIFPLKFDLPLIPRYRFPHEQFSQLLNGFYRPPKHHLQLKQYHQLPARMSQQAFLVRLQTQRRASSRVFWIQIHQIRGERWSFCRCLKHNFVLFQLKFVFLSEKVGYSELDSDWIPFFSPDTTLNAMPSFAQTSNICFTISSSWWRSESVFDDGVELNFSSKNKSKGNEKLRTSRGRRPKKKKKKIEWNRSNWPIIVSIYVHTITTEKQLIIYKIMRK